jgi:hypothetical protein
MKRKNTENTQLELSYELLHFLQWLLEHPQEHKTLKSMVQRSLALHHGPMPSQKAHSPEEIQNLHYSLIDFFALLDGLLYETLHDKNLHKVTKSKLIETIQHIDGTLCDVTTLQNSIEKTTDEIERFPAKNAKTVLFENLLKQWRPAKGGNVH